MRYLKLFNFVNEYNEYIKGEGVLLPNVSYVTEEDSVYFNALKSIGGLDPALLEVAGTAIVYDVDASQLITIAGDDYDSTTYPQDKYVPVGVVIMPASHSEDGMARMMSCKMLGVKTSDNGTVSYGSFDADDVSEYDNMGSIAWASPDSTVAVASTVSLLTAKPQFPISQTQPSAVVDSNTGVINPYQTDTNGVGIVYYTDMMFSEEMASMLGTSWIPDGDGEYGWNGFEGGESVCMPSPYNSDGTPNIGMRVSGSSMGIVHGSIASNMVNDFMDSTNGYHRFDVFTSARQYSTSGTNVGDWYVPSPLELAYFSARMKKIYSTMNKMNPKFDEVFDNFLVSQGLDSSYLESGKDINYLASWSSTLYSESGAWIGGLPIRSFIDDVYYDVFAFAVAPVRNL